MKNDVLLSCGHFSGYRPTTGFPLILKRGDCVAEGNLVKCVRYLNVCHSCYISYIKTEPDNILFGETEVSEYLNG